jgi:hypothetical protein
LVSVWLMSQVLAIEGLAELVGLISAVLGLSMTSAWKPFIRLLDRVNPPRSLPPEQNLGSRP